MHFVCGSICFSFEVCICTENRYPNNKPTAASSGCFLYMLVPQEALYLHSLQGSSTYGSLAWLMWVAVPLSPCLQTYFYIYLFSFYAKWCTVEKAGSVRLWSNRLWKLWILLKSLMVTSLCWPTPSMAPGVVLGTLTCDIWQHSTGIPKSMCLFGVLIKYIWISYLKECSPWSPKGDVLAMSLLGGEDSGYGEEWCLSAGMGISGDPPE